MIASVFRCLFCVSENTVELLLQNLYMNRKNLVCRDPWLPCKEIKGRKRERYSKLSNSSINNFRAVKGLVQKESTRTWMRIGYEVTCRLFQEIYLILFLVNSMNFKISVTGFIGPFFPLPLYWSLLSHSQKRKLK